MFNAKTLGILAFIVLLFAAHSASARPHFRTWDYDYYGAAVATDLGDRLVLSNIGASGDDGIQFNPGFAEGIGMRFLTPVAPGPGQSLIFEADDDSVPVPQTIGTVQVQPTAGGAGLDILIGNTGGDRVIARAMFNGAIVAESEILPDPLGLPSLAGTCFDTPSAAQIIELTWRSLADSSESGDVAEVVFENPCGVLLNGLSAPVQADAMILVLIPGLGDSSIHTAARLGGVNLLPIEIKEVVVRQFGNDHIGTGTAQSHACHDCLVISNIGSSGDDGVDIEAEEHFFTIVLENATVSGIDQLDLAIWRDNYGETSSVEFDIDPDGAFDLSFGGAGDPVKNVSYFNGKFLVARDTVNDSGNPDLPVIVGRAPNPGAANSHNEMKWDNVSNLPWQTHALFDPPIEFLPAGGGGPIVIDRIVIETTSPPSVPGMNIHEVQLRVSASPTPGGAELTILGESTASPCPTDFNGDGVTDGADLAGLLAVWGLNAALADFNADGIVDGADLAQMLAAWGPCPE